MSNQTIKYRAWDRQRKTWATISNLPLMSNGNGVYQFTQDGQERFDHQRWTGLFDKDGEEIYEGDIIMTCHGPLEVFWSNKESRYSVVIPKNRGINEGAPLKDALRYSPTIIGNIYNRPDLVK